MARTWDGRLKSPREHSKWSAMDLFVLESLVGKVPYQMIALKLGRTPGAVQRQASTKKFSARRNWANDRAVRQSQIDRITEARLAASEEELAQFL